MVPTRLHQATDSLDWSCDSNVVSCHVGLVISPVLNTFQKFYLFRLDDRIFINDIISIIYTEHSITIKGKLQNYINYGNCKIFLC